MRITPAAERLTFQTVAGTGDQDEEHAGTHVVLPQVLLGDQVLAVLPVAVDDGDRVCLAERPHPSGEPARHPHQVRVVELLVAVAVQPSPPDPEPAWRMPEGEVGIEHDPVHTVVAAPQKIPVPLAELVHARGHYDHPRSELQCCPEGATGPERSLGTGVGLLAVWACIMAVLLWRRGSRPAIASDLRPQP